MRLKLIEVYLQSLLDLVAASPFVRASTVTFDKRTPHIGLIRGDLYFADDSRLYFRELVKFGLQSFAGCTATTTRMLTRI